MTSIRTLRVAALVAALLIGATTSLAGIQPEYTFKVYNRTDTKITKLLASEDGENYGAFDIGSGIAAGKSATLVWDKSTDESNCEWLFVAVYADGSESEPVAIDFCEEDLELEFTD
jgi:hypothetical protein